jgi:hypothetical protein
MSMRRQRLPQRPSLAVKVLSYSRWCFHCKDHLELSVNSARTWLQRIEASKVRAKMGVVSRKL